MPLLRGFASIERGYPQPASYVRPTLAARRHLAVLKHHYTLLSVQAKAEANISLQT